MRAENDSMDFWRKWKGNRARGKENQQSSFEQGFNIHAGSIQREYYLFFRNK